MISAMVFDLDGTIADTESSEYEAIRLVFAEHGLDYPVSRWSHVVGQAWNVAWADELAAEVGGEVDRATLLAHKRALHTDLLAALVPRPGVLALLDEAGRAGVPLAIASNSDRAWVTARLLQLGLTDEFVSIATIDDVAAGKPDPEPFLTACAGAGADPDRAVAFEDSAPGVRSAVAAGLYTVACPGPLTADHDLTPADRIVASLEQVDMASLTSALGGAGPLRRSGGVRNLQPDGCT